MNNRYGRTYLNAILLSAISAGAQLSQPRSGGGVLSSPSVGELAVSTEMIRNMQAGPTMEIPRDFALTIYVRQGLGARALPALNRWRELLAPNFRWNPGRATF